MVEFTLPANSKVGVGKTVKAPPGAKRVKTFKVYRWNPDDGQNPRVDSYEIDLDACARCAIQGLNDGRLGERVQLGDDARRLAGEGVLRLAYDFLD